MDAALERLLARHVAEGTMPGAVASIGHDLSPVVVGAAGPDGSPLRPDAIFRIQSMTKLVTTVAALRLVEQGAIALDDPVDPWMPELADRRVLADPQAELSDTVPAARPITLRHLLTNQSGYGMLVTESPLHEAMRDAGVEAENVSADRDAQEWLDALAGLPLAFHPGEGWRYHLSFAVLGILLGRIAGATTADLLRREIFEPVGMPDTGFRVSDEEAHRLPPAFRRNHEGFFDEVEPAGGGFHTGPAPFDESHGELVSTLADYHAFLRALVDGDLVSRGSLEQLRTDQVDPSVKTPDSFFPGFWNGTGWGFGVSVTTEGPHRGRFGWSGGCGTDFFVDPDGTICLVLTQVEMDDKILALIGELQGIRD